MKDALGKFGKKAAEATKKGQDLAGNMWQHCISLPIIHVLLFLYLKIPVYHEFELFHSRTNHHYAILLKSET